MPPAWMQRRPTAMLFRKRWSSTASHKFFPSNGQDDPTLAWGIFHAFRSMRYPVNTATEAHWSPGQSSSFGLRRPTRSHQPMRGRDCRARARRMRALRPSLSNQPPAAQGRKDAGEVRLRRHLSCFVKRFLALVFHKALFFHAAQRSSRLCARGEFLLRNACM